MEETKKSNKENNDVQIKEEKFPPIIPFETIYSKFAGDKLSTFIELKELITSIDEQKSEISKTSTHALNISLVIFGIGVVFLAFGLLFPSGDKEWFQYVSKVSFAVFLEIFAFLMYRFANENRRFSQFLINEKSTITLRIASLKLALSSESYSTIHQIALEMSKSDRNYSESETLDTKMAESMLKVIPEILVPKSIDKI